MLKDMDMNEQHGSTRYKKGEVVEKYARCTKPQFTFDLPAHQIWIKRLHSNL